MVTVIPSSEIDEFVTELAPFAFVTLFVISDDETVFPMDVLQPKACDDVL